MKREQSMMITAKNGVSLGFVVLFCATGIMRGEVATEKAPGQQPPAVNAEKQVKAAVQLPDPTIAAPRTGRWLNRHESMVQEAKKYTDAKLLFVGDSITDGWRGGGRRVFNEYYADLHTFNIGISGDCTQHVLWRLDHGEIDGLSPKVVVLMIGTNNNRSPDADIARGVKAVVESLRQKLPQSKILLLGVFPRGANPDNPLRAKLKKVNEVIAKLDDGKNVTFLDIGEKFLEADGSLSKSVMPDALHPCDKGYGIWADAMNPTLEQLLGEKIIKHEQPKKVSPAVAPESVTKTQKS